MRRRRPAKAPAGLRRPAAGHPVGRLEGGDRLPSEAELGADSSACRASPSGGRCAICRPPAWSSGARARAPSCKAARHAARTLVRAADSRSRRDRDLRADLPGDDGVAAGAQARAALGQPADGAAASRRSGRGSCAASTSSGASRVCSSRRSSRRRTSDDVNRRIVEALDAARIPVVLLDRPALPYPQRGHARPGRHRQPARRLRDHRAPAACSGRGAIAFVAMPGMRRQRSMRARPAIAKRSTPRASTSTARLVPRLDPAESAAVVRS